MIDDILKSQIEIFKSVFKGREDVFAVRWEKGNKSDYMPAYLYDVYRYRIHKMKGGTLQNFTEKTYLTNIFFHFFNFITIRRYLKSILSFFILNYLLVLADFEYLK